MVGGRQILWDESLKVLDLWTDEYLKKGFRKESIIERLLTAMIWCEDSPWF